MSKNKKKKGLGSGINHWIANKSEGNEKRWIIGMLVIAFLLFAFTIYKRYNTPKEDKLTIKQTIEMVSDTKPEATIGINDAMNSFKEMDKAERGLEIIQTLQYELDKKVIDTTKVKMLYEELQSLGINIPLK